MSTLKPAFAAFRKSIGREKNQIAAFNRIRDALNTLGEDELPLKELVEQNTRLTQALSKCIPILHKSRARPTLTFCAVAIAWLLDTKLMPAIKSGIKSSVVVWEDAICNGLIQPILDIARSEDQDATMIGDTLYPTICQTIRSSCSAESGGRFARSLALILLDTCSISKNKAILLDPKVFGTQILSNLIIQAKDYHLLDTLLELSFSMFSTQNGTITRENYAEALFKSEYAVKNFPEEVCTTLARIHAITTGSDSEKNVLDIIHAMATAQIGRPQIFSTRNLSYCGTKYSQRAPSNFIVLDSASLCVIICDKDMEIDVLTLSLTSVESAQLTVQDDPMSRILVDLVVSEPPLISSIREVVETPISQQPGAPLRLRVSVESSDLLRLEAALAARSLETTIVGYNVFTKHPSLADRKVSKAALEITLPSSEKPNRLEEKTDELMSKYVNIPSSNNHPTSPSGAIIVESAAASPKKTMEPSAVPKEISVPIVAPKKSSPNQLVNPPLEFDSIENDTNPLPLRKPQGRPPKAKKISHPKNTPAADTGRPQRASAARAAKAIQKRALEIFDQSDISEAEFTPDQPRRMSSTQTQIEAPELLPTPPQTRPKILVPTTPIVEQEALEYVTSPVSEIMSPTSKVIAKRKYTEDNSVQPSKVIQRRPVKQRKVDDAQPEDTLPSTQHIVPRNAAVIRPRAKYNTNAKETSISSPGSARSTNNEDVGSSVQEQKFTYKSCSLLDDSTRAHSPPTEQKLDSALDTTSSTTQADSLDAGYSKMDIVANKAKHSTLTSSKGRNAPPKIRPERLTKGAQRQKISTPSKAVIKGHVSVEPALAPAISSQLVHETQPDDVVQISDAEVDISHSQDELLEALSRAAKKATRFSALKSKSIQPYSPSLTKEALPASVANREGEDINVEKMDTSEEVLEPSPSKLAARPSHTTETSQLRDLLPHEPLKMLVKEPGSDKDSIGSAQAWKATVQVTQDQKPENIVPANIAIMDTSPINTEEEIRGQAVEEPGLPVPPSGSHKPIQVYACKQAPKAPEATLASDCLVAHVLSTSTSGPFTETLKAPKDAESSQSSKRIHQVQYAPAQPPRLFVKSPINKAFLDRVSSVSIDSDNMDSEEDEPLQVEFTQPIVSPVPRPKPRASHTSNPIFVNPKSRPQTTLQAPAKIKPEYETLSRLLRCQQINPKSAFASQKRKRSGGGRPSVSFVDAPSLPHHKSSNSPTSSKPRKEYSSILGGMSTRTGGIMLHIIEVLDAIQTTIIENLGGKVKTVTKDVSNARTELTRTIITQLEAMKAHAESHLNILHEFEGAFATETKAFLGGRGQIDKCNAQIDIQTQEVLTKNAQSGHRIATATIGFELPEEIMVHLQSE